MSQVEDILIRPLALWYGLGKEPTVAQVKDMEQDYQGYSDDDFAKAVKWVKRQWKQRDRFPPPGLIAEGLERCEIEHTSLITIIRGSIAWTDWDIFYSDAYEDGFISERTLKDFKKKESLVVPRTKPFPRRFWHYYQNWMDARTLKKDES